MLVFTISSATVSILCRFCSFIKSFSSWAADFGFVKRLLYLLGVCIRVGFLNSDAVWHSRFDWWSCSSIYLFCFISEKFIYRAREFWNLNYLEFLIIFCDEFPGVVKTLCWTPFSFLIFVCAGLLIDFFIGVKLSLMASGLLNCLYARNSSICSNTPRCTKWLQVGYRTFMDSMDPRLHSILPVHQHLWHSMQPLVVLSTGIARTHWLHSLHWLHASH